MNPKALLIDVFGKVIYWRSGIIRDLAKHFERFFAVTRRRQ